MWNYATIFEVPYVSDMHVRMMAFEMPKTVIILSCFLHENFKSLCNLTSLSRLFQIKTPKYLSQVSFAMFKAFRFRLERHKASRYY